MTFERRIPDPTVRHLVCDLPSNATWAPGTRFRCTCNQLYEVRRTGWLHWAPGAKTWKRIRG